MAWSEAARAAAAEARKMRAKGKPGPRPLAKQMKLAADRRDQVLETTGSVRNANRYTKLRMALKQRAAQIKKLSGGVSTSGQSARVSYNIRKAGY